MAERVQVVVRIRPFISSDPPDAELNAIVLDDAHVRVGGNRCFQVDRVYMMEAGSEDIYRETVSPLVARFLAGFNTSVLAYGQTGTGKTYTVQTMLPLLLAQVLESPAIREGISSNSGIFMDKAQPQLQLQYVEVYGETIRDLLEDPTTQRDPHKPNKVRLVATTAASPMQRRSSSPVADGFERRAGAAPPPLTPTSGGMHTSCAVVGARVAAARTIQEAAALIALGDARRATGATNVHEHSSRSHAILTLFHPRYACRLDVVDLAGSEREKKTGNTGIRFQESIAINTGLLALGNVIRALSHNHRVALIRETSKSDRGGGSGYHNPLPSRLVPTSPAAGAGVSRRAQHVPYRSSKLTRLLQDTLGGSSATVFIACIAPDTHNQDETLRTLQYCSLALQIVNAPARQYDRLQREQSRGRGGRRGSGGNSPSSETYNGDDVEGRRELPSRGGESSFALAARVDELQSSLALLQQQYDEQGEVLASICESYAEAKDRLKLCEKELRKDEGLFTRQMRVMQQLMQENQKLRHRAMKMEAIPKLKSRKHRGDQHHGRSASTPEAEHTTEKASKGSDAAGHEGLQNDVAALLRNLLHRHNATHAAEALHEHGDESPLVAETGARAAAAAAAADGPPPVSAFSPYRHLSFRSGSTMAENVGIAGAPVELMKGQHTHLHVHGASTPGTASAATSEPVQSFIQSLLRQQGILMGKEVAGAAVASVPAPNSLQSHLHTVADVDDVLHQRTPQDAVKRAVSPPSMGASAGAVEPSLHQPASDPRMDGVQYPSNEGAAPLPTKPSVPHQGAQYIIDVGERGAPRSPDRDGQLLQLANVVLHYEKTNADLRNEVCLLQARLDDKSREAARLRLEVQDVKDAYASLSALSE
ncbi:putative kinesin [Leptomonas seymouri]|uniref:Putative kinesin n=1 Tax=Leptomonas seymouri TaxID=5684 RepID=A0A0N0P569_LEPSE|nr:putative kinesin [Leptomonas seymouri]|eukprot:KPI86116.1 putative kinesin [Leptomonas seymouri]